MNEREMTWGEYIWLVCISVSAGILFLSIITVEFSYINSMLLLLLFVGFNVFGYKYYDYSLWKKVIEK